MADLEDILPGYIVATIECKSNFRPLLLHEDPKLVIHHPAKMSERNMAAD